MRSLFNSENAFYDITALYRILIDLDMKLQ